MNNNLKDIINSCPFTTEYSRFEQQHFMEPAAAGYPRYVIGLVNRYRKVSSDIDQETRTFEKQVLLEEKTKIENILASQDPDELGNAINNWENVEPEYWADMLGKISAIEILTKGKVSYDTMLKMAKLPEDLYIKATQICVKLANAINQKTIEAEEEIGVEPPIYDVESDITPKKLFLKKTK